jgi:hypothetical protein
MNIAGRQFNRREALAGGAGLLGGGALAALITAPVVAADGSNSVASVEGAWLVHVVPDEGSPDPSPYNVLYLVIKSGGIAAVSDHPPTTGSTGFGAWKATADNQFVSTFELFVFPPAGAPAGILRVRTLGSIDKATDQLTGRATVDFKPTVSPSPDFFPAGTTHFTGTRIKALAPDVVGDPGHRG